MSSQDIPLHDWAALYEAAVEFRNLRCWEWMADSDLFGVENPETGEIGYCSVLGQLGEVMALNVYPGSEGLASYWRLHDAAGAAIEEGRILEGRFLLGTQLCLMASFESRSELHENDLGIIRALGLKFRGKKEWPMFRSYRPGFVPWFLTPEEARFLPVALRQAVNVATRFKDDPDLLEPRDGNTELYLVRTLEGRTWTDRWQTPSPYEPPKPVSSVDEVRLARIQHRKFPKRRTWHGAFLLLPMIIEEGERPYYAYGFPVMRDDGLALGIEVFKPGEAEAKLPSAFLDLVEGLKYLPELLLVMGENAFPLLEPVAKRLGFRIQQADHLPTIEVFVNSMEEFMNRR